MEFLRGTPLGARINGQPPLSLDDKLNIVAQLCDGLSYAHDQGVVHRDVKPDNVFILEDGSVKLLDFGIAKLTSSNLTRQGDVLGSASYMSPEQVGGSDSVDGRADVFSTGVLLYELLTRSQAVRGRCADRGHPQDPEGRTDANRDLRPGPAAAAGCRGEKALAKDPDARFPTADALGRELQMIRKALPASRLQRGTGRDAVRQHADDEGPARGPSEAARSERRAARLSPSAKPPRSARGAVAAPEPASGNKWLVPALIGLVVVLGAGGYFMFGGTSQPAPSATVASTTTTTAPPPHQRHLPRRRSQAPERPQPRRPRSHRRRRQGRQDIVQAAAPRPVAAVPMVPVSMAGGYPFEILEGGRVISAASTDA